MSVSGWSVGTAVSAEYESPGTLQGGTVLGVGMTVEKAQYVDLEKVAAAALARD